MEINKLIDDLLHSGILENKELGATLLRSPDISLEEKMKHIHEFVKEYTEGKVNFFSEENSNLFKIWVDLYLSVVKNDVKNRVKKIE